MPVSAGTLLLASEYNPVAVLVIKILGDMYAAVLVTAVDRTHHTFGWGAGNLEDALTDGTLITGERLQSMINRTNVMVDHVNNNDTILVFSVPANRTDILAKTLIGAEELNFLETGIYETNEERADREEAERIEAEKKAEIKAELEEVDIDIPEEDVEEFVEVYQDVEEFVESIVVEEGSCNSVTDERRCRVAVIVTSLPC